MPTEATPRTVAEPRAVVTAVVVAHQGARWLPELRAAVEAQTRPPDLVVAADTGSNDGSAAALEDWVSGARLAILPARSGYGEAVHAALETAPIDLTDPRQSWVWLLHDDCAPAPDALEQLLAATDRDPRVAVVGPKVRAWNDRRLLLEVGLTIARGGRRETQLERREQDQGQHDGTRGVLAVGSAGMLVRRDVWDALEGFDPRIPFLRDDVDLGWRANLAGHRVVCTTDAVVYHAEAGARRRRPVRAGGHRLHRMDRQHAMYVLLANLPLLLVPVALVSLTLGSLLRAVGWLAGKLPGHAADELLALFAVLLRPDRLFRARMTRRRTRTVPARTALPMLAPRGAGWRHAMDAAAVMSGARAGEAVAGRHRAERRGTSVPATGPTAEEDEELPSWSSGLLRRVLFRPSVGLALGLAVVSLLAARGLVGDGRLMGGALLPAPDSAGDLWRSYLATWHPVGLGSDTDAPPYLAVLAAMASVLGGPERAVDLVLLAAVPLAGLTSYLALRRVVRSVPLKLLAATGYALLPALLGAVAAGRLGTAVVAVLLPVAALAVTRALGLDGPDRRSGSNRSTWAAVLVLAVMTAFVPMTTVLVLLLAGVAAAVVRGANLLRLALLVVAPALLLLPWLPAVAAEPQLLLLEAGLPGPGLADRVVPPVELLLLRPGGPGMPPLLLTAAVLLTGLAALLRPDRRRPVLAGWVLALVGLAAAVVVSRVEVTAPTLETPVPAWPGPATLLAGAGLLLAAVVGAEGARARVARSNFGWRQPSAALLAVLAVATPAALAGWWVVSEAGGPLERRDPVLLPAFVAAEGDGPDRPRTLVLRARGAGDLSYALLRSEGPRTGDAELSPSTGASARLDAVVADLASGRGGDAAARLVPYGVRFVLLGRPIDRSVARAIDAVPGVVRVSGPAGAILWRIDYTTGRLRVLPPGAKVVDADGAPPPARVLRSGQVRAAPDLPAGDAGRLLVLADPRDEGWRAGLDGQALPAQRYDGWAQAFRLPADGGQLLVRHEHGLRTTLLWVQLGLVLLVVVLALPQARTVDDEDLADEGRHAAVDDAPGPTVAASR
jgi:GT2 family glycosyltransferase